MLFIYDSRFDEVFGELVDDLVAMLGDDALVVLDGDLLADAAELVGDRHGAPAGVGLGPGDARRAAIRISSVDGVAHGQELAFEARHEVRDVEIEVPARAAGYPLAVRQPVFLRPPDHVILERDKARALPATAFGRVNPFLDVLAVQFEQVPFPLKPLVRFVLHIRLELTLDLLARTLRVRVPHLPGDEIARSVITRRHGAEQAPTPRRRSRTVLLRPCGYDDAPY